MSVSEEHAVQPAATAAPTSGIADPAPLGLAAFALTTFLLSARNANWTTHSLGEAFFGYAFAYGGLCQLLAGMWEFRNRNVFGAVAFSTYGGFWIGVGIWFRFVAVPALTAAKTPAELSAAFTLVNHDLGWLVLAFAIFNTYMLVLSTQINTAVFAVFLTLEITEIFLTIGNFKADGVGTTGLIQVGGYAGLVTALVAWYTSFALVSRGMAGGKIVLPVGPALIK